MDENKRQILAEIEADVRFDWSQKSVLVVDKNKGIEQNNPIEIPAALQFACQPRRSISNKSKDQPSTAISLTVLLAIS